MANYGNKRKNPWGFTAPNYVNRQMPGGKRRRAMLLSNTFYKATKYRSGIAKSRNQNIRRDTFKFKRSCTLGSFASAVGGEVFGASTFNLAHLPNYTEFTSLFDRYRITHIQVQFFLKYSPDSGAADPAGNQQNATHPILYLVKDYDDSTVPGGINALREHAKVQMRIMDPNKVIKFNIKPSTLSETYRSAVATTYSPQWKNWIDMAHPDTPYYGLKFGAENFFGQNQTIQMRATYWFECKDTR